MSSSSELSPLPPMPPVGTRISLESARLQGRMWSQLLGWRADHYVLFETPEQHIPAGISAAFGPDDVLTVRYMDDGLIVGFRTPVLRRINTPFPITIAAYPRHVQTHSLRRHPRMSCYLPCRIRVAELDLDVRAVIRDVSLTGCRLRVLAEDIDAAGIQSAEASIDIGATVTIELRLPEDTEDQHIEGRVVNFEHDAEGHIVLRLESTGELSRLIEFVGMFTTRMQIQEPA